MNIFETLKKYNNMNGGSLENTSLKRNILVPCEEYEISKDRRLLIPFEYNGLKGFMNKEGVIVIKPKYHRICNECYSESDLIKVSVLKAIPISYGSEAKMIEYYGVIDCNGVELFELKYKHIQKSTDSKLLTLVNLDGLYSVVTIDGKEIIPSKKYAWIDGFDLGLGRFNTFVDGKKKWGIINDVGEEVVPPIYDEIWKFYGKNRTTTKCIKDGHSVDLSLKDFSIVDNKKCFLRKNTMDNNYGSHYGEFAGSYAQDVMGYSDDVINDAFEGDPDNYWNID
jgi:hypothetical protein